MPKPNVASARNSPESRIAGNATSAPTGTASRAPSSAATSHGSPSSTCSWEKATAPIAANAAWHSETWPDVRTSSPSDSRSRAVTSATVHAFSVEPTSCGSTSSGTSTTTASAIRSRGGARYCGGGRTSARPGGASRRFGSTSSATNRTTNGSDAGSPASHGTSSTKVLETSETMPMAIPPTNVSGMLENAPTAAAPKACTTRNVSPTALSPISGATSTPDSAANVAPITHETRRTRCGSVPCMASRSGSSTTARIATPVRDQRNSP